MSSYTKFVRLLERWPVDSAKKGKDLGEAVRRLFQHSYSQGSVTQVDEKRMNCQVAALQRLADNKHQTAHPRLSEATFTMLDREVLHQITNTKLMDQVTADSEEEKPGLLQRLRNFRLL
jgi:hypothetical protein